jgi:threonine dehydratase
MTDLATLDAAADLVHEVMQPTPQYCWPLLAERCGAEVWVKHENHTQIGAFKIRGGLVFAATLKREQPDAGGVICATRGNHGQSVATAARRFGLRAVIVVPEGNSVEKNAAMKAQGGELVVHGSDFQAALEYAEARAAEEKLCMFPSFHELLIRGVATYALELFRGAPELDTVYVPIGLGSGICGVLAARDALNLKTKVVGVVAANAAAYALSFHAGEPVATNSADTMADGLACRVPNADAVARINAGVERVIEVEDAEIEAAMRHYYTDTHNIAEGAGAAGLAGLLKERDAMRGKRVGVVLSGGNVDTDVYRRVLANGEA